MQTIKNCASRAGLGWAGGALRQRTTSCGRISEQNPRAGDGPGSPLGHRRGFWPLPSGIFINGECVRGCGLRRGRGGGWGGWGGFMVTGMIVGNPQRQPWLLKPLQRWLRTRVSGSVSRTAHL